MSRARPLALSTFLVGALALGACGTSPSGGDASQGQPTAPAPSLASPSAATSPAASPASPAASPAASPSAAAQTEVVGVEYAYQNVPQSAAVGTTFTFRNDGQEVHEMLVVRRNADVTESWQELLAMPEDQVANLATVVGNAFAGPGQTAEGAVTVDQPGDYLMVCFIPTGTTSLPDDESATLPPGAPHFTQGMLQEFSVTE